ncbi:hypothetical protein Droror1_Dr00015495 [Drosera rotundifolia]
MVFVPLASEKKAQERFKKFMHKVKTLKPTKGIMKKTKEDCCKETEKQERQKIREAARLKLQEIQKRQEHKKMRETARLKLQKMEELADYVDNMAVMNDFLRLTGNHSLCYTENSCDNFRFWNRRRHSIKKEKANPDKDKAVIVQDDMTAVVANVVVLREKNRFWAVKYVWATEALEALEAVGLRQNSSNYASFDIGPREQLGLVRRAVASSLGLLHIGFLAVKLVSQNQLGWA